MDPGRKIVAEVGCATLAPGFDHKIALKGTLAGATRFSGTNDSTPAPFFARRRY